MVNLWQVGTNWLPAHKNVINVVYQQFKILFMMDNQKRKAYCPLDFAFQRIGGKYKGRIIWFLKDGILRYGELKRAVEGISTKMLTQALKELEEDMLIERRAYVELPPRVEYKITPTGKGLVPAIDSMRLWAVDQLQTTEA